MNVQNKIEITKVMLDYQIKQHEDILGNIPQIRNVCNYVVTAIFAFSGFVISSKDFLQDSWQWSVFWLIFLVIILIWLFWINKSVIITTGFDTLDVIDNLNDNNDALTYFGGVITKAQENYKEAKNAVDYIDQGKTTLIHLSALFILITVLFFIYNKFQ